VRENCAFVYDKLHTSRSSRGHQQPWIVHDQRPGDANLGGAAAAAGKNELLYFFITAALRHG
jgi:hypothetical protein